MLYLLHQEQADEILLKQIDDDFKEYDDLTIEDLMIDIYTLMEFQEIIVK